MPRKTDLPATPFFKHSPEFDILSFSEGHIAYEPFNLLIHIRYERCIRQKNQYHEKNF